ncbi:hypothetical protein [Stenotrophomonas sp.]|uniref:hypothetical protein n=1 Tax=Stenotrophomonas sp. TaxID=69392 RepID=UPI0028968924|nr:hypothetical protein [Stenotrophomonas sp.]
MDELNGVRLRVSDLVDSTGMYGKRVLLSGVLIVRGADCYVASELDSRDVQLSTSSRVSVFHPGLEETLDKTVAAWVGGPASYFDAVLIEGVVNAATTRRDLASISQLSRMTVFREEGTYEFEWLDSFD